MNFYCPFCGTECECEEDLEKFEEKYIQRYFNCNNTNCKKEFIYYHDRLCDKITIKVLD